MCVFVSINKNKQFLARFWLFEYKKEVLHAISTECFFVEILNVLKNLEKRSIKINWRVKTNMMSENLMFFNKKRSAQCLSHIYLDTGNSTYFWLKTITIPLIIQYLIRYRRGRSLLRGIIELITCSLWVTHFHMKNMWLRDIIICFFLFLVKIDLNEKRSIQCNPRVYTPTC